MPTNGAQPQVGGPRHEERGKTGSCRVEGHGVDWTDRAEQNDRYKEGIAGTDILFRFGIVEIVTGCRTSVQKRHEAETRTEATK